MHLNDRIKDNIVDNDHCSLKLEGWKVLHFLSFLCRWIFLLRGTGLFIRSTCSEFSLPSSSMFSFILNFKQLSSLSLMFLLLLGFLDIIRGDSHSSQLLTESSSGMEGFSSQKNLWQSASLAVILFFGSFSSILESRSSPKLL